MVIFSSCLAFCSCFLFFFMILLCFSYNLILVLSVVHLGGYLGRKITNRGISLLFGNDNFYYCAIAAHCAQSGLI
jgi:hypothetical protein